MMFAKVIALAAVIGLYGVRAAESEACLEPTAWEDGGSDEACWLNAPFSDGDLHACSQLEPDEEEACVSLCEACFAYCNDECDHPTTIFEDNEDPLVAGCSCVQATPESGANAIGPLATATVTVTIATAAYITV